MNRVRDLVAKGPSQLLSVLQKVEKGVHYVHISAWRRKGGNVYVVDSLLYFVKNTEQLAGTLGHEVSHTIHRDAVARMEQDQKIKKREIGAAILLGPTLAQAMAISMIGDLNSLAYSREVESSADVTGSDICAAAGVRT